MNHTKQFTFLVILTLLANLLHGQDAAEEKKVFINNEATINTDNLEYSPAFFEDGIVFISSKYLSKKFKVKDKRIDKNIMSIFQARREESGLLQVPIHFANELMTTVHEGPLTFDRTAERVFFTRNNLKNGKRKKAKDGIVKLKIYAAEKVGDRWINVEELPFNDDESNTCHPAISVNGDMLYFASDRPGSLGGMDIWMSKKTGDEWGEPMNLGPEINTEADEVFPFVHADGSLIFASNGHAGFGGLDIFFSTKTGDNWAKPTNVKAPFNSENDDFGCIIDRDKKNGYFSSNRPGGFGEDDIYSFYISGNGLDELFEDEQPKELKNFDMIITSVMTGDIIEGANITYTNLDNLNLSNAISDQGQVSSVLQLLSEENRELLLRIPLDANAQNGSTDNWGKLPVTLSSGNYVFIVEKEGFQSHQMVLDTKRDDTEIFISLNDQSDEDLAGNNNGNSGNGGDPDGANPNDPNANPNGSTDTGMPAPTFNTGDDNNDGTTFPSTIKEGTVFQLPNIYYNFNDATIRPDARIDLDALADFLINYPDIEIELSSHTDSRGGTRYNRKLSQKRAENAVRYLIGRGLAPNRLTAVGYGEGQVRNHCTDGKDCSEEEHQYNRRTEVKITKMSQEINIQFVNRNNSPTYTDDSYTRGSSNDEPSTSTDTGATVNNDSGSSRFSVVAGVFGDYQNAQKRVNKLLNLGYDQTQIISEGDRYSVVVQRCENMQQAKELKRNLSDDSIRSFVKS
ncbi:MAG: OmpA family protein [Bacteroidota bacterium]